MKDAQHYIQQAYLRQWSANGLVNEKSKIYRFDKTGQAPIALINTKEVAHENNFYDFIDAKGEQRSADPLLLSGEHKFGTVINHLCSQPSTRLLDTYKKDLAEFIAIQILRTKATQDFLLATSETVVEVASKLFGAKMEQNTGNDLTHIQARLIEDEINNRRIADTLLQEKSWMLVINKNKRGFWTSDVPCFKTDDEMDLIAFRGILDEKGYLFVALSPRVALLLNHDDDANTYIDPFLVSDNRVKYFNQCQILFARRWIFSNNSDFILAEKIIQKHPELAKSSVLDWESSMSNKEFLSALHDAPRYLHLF